MSPATRKKGATVRAWLVVDVMGHGQVLEAGKHDIMRRTGLPGRDLRILDPVLSYPSTVLGRERAIVVNLEHIKSIITAQEVLFMNSSDPLVTPFVQKLEAIFRHRQAVIKLSQEARVDDKNEEWANLRGLVEPQTVGSPPYYTRSVSTKNDDENANREQQAAENPQLKFLPFEFVALEACLEAACSCLDNQARTLEQEAYPALDKLTLKISTLNLESVRQIKSRLVAIAGRVQKVRDELEQLLDDDGDMAEMYLSDKLEQQQFENSPASSINAEDDDPNRAPADVSMEGHENSAVSDGDDIRQSDNQPDQIAAEGSTFRRGSYRSQILTRTDVQELEMILEAYFVQIDGTLNKLSTLREYVDDTEDYINMMLDDKQNHLLQMDVILTTANLVVGAFIAVTVVFGMNISIELFDPAFAGDPEFYWSIGGSTIGCVFLYIAAIAWCRHKRLLE